MDTAASTGERAVSKTRQQIINEAIRIEEACTFSAKGHFKAATVWSFFHLLLGLPTVMLAAISGASAFKSLPHTEAVAGYFSIGIVVLSSVVTFLNPNKRATEHLNAGNKYDALLNKVRIFRTIECWDESVDSILTERLRRHSEDKSTLNQSCPQIPWFGYVLAKWAIKRGETEFAIDKVSS